MAHKKGQGTSRNGRDSHSQRLGVKCFGGQKIHTGGIIIRQRGTKFQPGLGVKKAKDDSLYAMKDGVVSYYKSRTKGTVVSVVSSPDSQ